MAERTMSAKFGGWCKSCKSEIDVGAEIIWSRENGARHSTLGACEVAKAKTAKKKESVGTADLSPVIAFITEARDRGLKYPKLRVLDSDGSSELVLGLTGNRSKVPGSVTVKRDGEYLGLVRPTGEAFGAWDAPELFDAKLIVHLVQLAENPAIAAKEYAGLVGACSFCGSTITDEGSVEVGYGPVCAKNWGLPHTPKGTKVFDPSATEMAA
tara:strand:+ start:380 stop:1015 length:636 start_codon:yes stop_codon:yes gene_type:complete